MSEIEVRCYAQYLQGPSNMRQCDYDATNIVKAVKGSTLHPNSFVNIKVRGKEREIREKNKDLAIECFAEWAAPHIDLFDSENKILIPIPSSQTTKDSPPNFRTAIIAETISKKCQTSVIVLPVIRFRTERQASHGGGSRDPNRLYKNMIVIDSLPLGEAILIDDIYTTGSHIQAASWVLEDIGISVLEAICCGRTCDASEKLLDPFRLPSESLDISRDKN